MFVVDDNHFSQGLHPSEHMQQLPGKCVFFLDTNGKDMVLREDMFIGRYFFGC